MNKDTSSPTPLSKKYSQEQNGKDSYAADDASFYRQRFDRIVFQGVGGGRVRRIFGRAERRLAVAVEIIYFGVEDERTGGEQGEFGVVGVKCEALCAKGNYRFAVKSGVNGVSDSARHVALERNCIIGVVVVRRWNRESAIR